MRSSWSYLRKSNLPLFFLSECGTFCLFIWFNLTVSLWCLRLVSSILRVVLCHSIIITFLLKIIWFCQLPGWFGLSCSCSMPLEFCFAGIDPLKVTCNAFWSTLFHPWSPLSYFAIRLNLFLSVTHAGPRSFSLAVLAPKFANRPTNGSFSSAYLILKQIPACDCYSFLLTLQVISPIYPSK